MQSLIVIATLLVCAYAAVGPSVPMGGAGSCAGNEEGYKMVDAENMCWYHECVLNEEGGLIALPRCCALGSKVSYNFVSGMHNPCTINFDSTYGYDCTRQGPSVDGPPPCYDQDVRLECYNGGTSTYEANVCWCECPESWQGDYDCSKPTRDLTDLPPASDICVNGEPLDDFCAKEDGGCLNGGSCYNQCDTFYCLCPKSAEGYNDFYGKRCELAPK